MADSYIVVGLAYGDEGKGSWVDHLVRSHNIKHVVRFNGGAQANHNVVTTAGEHHGYAQFGAASFVPGVSTVLSRYMLVEPAAMLKEASVLESKAVMQPLARMIVSNQAPVITPFNQLLNRIQETFRAGARHGSCGMGVGLTQKDVEELGEDALYVKDLGRADLCDKLLRLHELKCEQARQYQHQSTAELIAELERVDLGYYQQLYAHFVARVRVVTDGDISSLIASEDTVFEGAQGVLLDQQYGFFPHCSRSNASFENAQRLLSEADFSGQITRIGLLRGYSTRHGAGPLVTQDNSLAIPHCHNSTNAWQGEFRHGWFDAVSARYALEVVGGVDLLAITNLDRMSALDKIKYATRYQNVDESYFVNARRLRIRREDITTLGERCQVLAGCIPEYRSLTGFNTSLSGMSKYLDCLEEELQHPIKAFSRSIDCHKEYL